MAREIATPSVTRASSPDDILQHKLSGLTVTKIPNPTKYFFSPARAELREEME